MAAVASTLLVAAAAAADPSLDVRIGANNKAAEAKLQARIDEQAPLASTPDDMKVLWELAKASRAVDAKSHNVENATAQLVSNSSSPTPSGEPSTSTVSW